MQKILQIYISKSTKSTIEKEHSKRSCESKTTFSLGLKDRILHSDGFCKKIKKKKVSKIWQ